MDRSSWKDGNYIQFLPLALAIGLGAVVMVLTGIHNTAYVDAEDYIAAAQSLLQHGVYPDSLKFPLFRPPLYPLILASVWYILPGSVVAIKVIQIFLNGVTAWLIFKIAYTLTRNKLQAAIAGMVFAVNPMFLYIASGIQTESIHTFLVTLPLYLMVKMIMESRIDWMQTVVIGIFFGLASLCRPTALGVGLVMMAVFFVLMLRVKGSLAASGAMAAVMFLTILPWTFYILKTRGEFFLITDAGGFNLWQGNNPNWIPIFRGDFKNAEDEDAWHKKIEQEIPDQIAEWEQTRNYSALSMQQRSDLWTKRALEREEQDPAAFAQLLLLKLYILWKPATNANAYSMGKTILSAATVIPIYLFGLWGFFKLRAGERTRKVTWLFLAIAVSMTLVHVAILSEIRYRLPYADPMLMVFSGVALGGLIMRFIPGLNFEKSAQEAPARSA
jgi:hypothetical protein